MANKPRDSFDFHAWSRASLAAQSALSAAIAAAQEPMIPPVAAAEPEADKQTEKLEAEIASLNGTVAKLQDALDSAMKENALADAVRFLIESGGALSAKLDTVGAQWEALKQELIDTKKQRDKLERDGAELRSQLATATAEVESSSRRKLEETEKMKKEQESLVKLVSYVLSVLRTRHESAQTAVTQQQKLFSQDMDIIRALMPKYPQVAAKQESPFATLMAQSSESDTQSGNVASSAFKFTDVPSTEAAAPANFVLPAEFTLTMGSNNHISSNDTLTPKKLPKRSSWLFQNTAKAMRFETPPSEFGTGNE